jgi:hypothetical protein
MKSENPYFKILKEQYISLIIVPIVIIGSILYYFHTKGILFRSEDEIITVVPFFGILIYIGVQILAFLMYLIQKNLVEALKFLIRLTIAGSLLVVYNYSSNFTQKVENFANEKQYYLRSMKCDICKEGIKNTGLKTFTFTGKKGTAKCGVVYDGTDTLLSDSGHRGIGNIELFNNGGWSRFTDSRDIVGKVYSVPVDGYKIETQFYYMCFDFDKKIELKNYKTKDIK